MSSADYVYTANMRYVRYTSVIITYSNRSTTLSSRLDLSGFCPGTETKREVWLLRTGSGIAPVNKLVSLTWLLGALRSFRSFTLHYIHTSIHTYIYIYTCMHTYIHTYRHTYIDSQTGFSGYGQRCSNRYTGFSGPQG